jgi:hypothetical protein
MFDDIACYMRLPDGWENEWFQTKSLDCLLDQYRITADGRLEVFRFETEKVGEPKEHPFFPDRKDWQEYRRINERWEEVEPAFHGDLYFYSSEPGQDGGRWAGQWHEYRARFTEGRVTSLIECREGGTGEEDVGATKSPPDGEAQRSEATEPNPPTRLVNEGAKP